MRVMNGVSSTAMDMSALSHPFASGEDFSSLYRQYFGFAWASLRRLGVSSATIDDAAQDLWVTVHRRLESLDPAASVKAWLFGIARRVASHYRRTEQRNRRKIAAYSVADLKRSSEPMKRREVALTMETFLSKLDETKRVAFVLSEVEGWSAPEIARIAGTNPNTVYSRVRLAKEQLRKHLRQADSELSPTECIDAVRSSTQPPAGASQRCWLALAPKLASGGAAAVATGGAFAKFKLMAIGALIGGAGIVGLDASLPDQPEAPPPVTAAFAPMAEAVDFVPAATKAPLAPHQPVEVAPLEPEPVVAPEVVEAPARPASDAAAARSAARSKRSAKPEAAPETAASVDSLKQETTLLAEAKRKLAAGQSAQATTLLARHASEFPNSGLADVRRVLEVQLMCRDGRKDEARKRAEKYARKASPAAASKLRAICP